MFEEEVIKTEESLTIKVRATKTIKHFYEKKELYRRNIEELIPQDLIGKVKLVSHPNKNISNFKSEKYTDHGEWIFEILKSIHQSNPLEKKKRQVKPRQQRTRTSRRKKATIDSEKQ